MIDAITAAAITQARTPARRAPAYSVVKPRQSRAKGKLTKYDVEEIRRWARTDGFGLHLAAQARVMASVYGVSDKATADVLTNDTWFDPSYSRGTPLEGAVIVPLGTAPGALFRLRWLLLFWRLLTCDFSAGSSGSNASPTTISR